MEMAFKHFYQIDDGVRFYCDVGKCLFGKNNTTILCNQSVCSSTMNLLRVLTEAGTHLESVKFLENGSSREAQMWTIKTGEFLKHLPTSKQ